MCIQPRVHISTYPVTSILQPCLVNTRCIEHQFPFRSQKSPPPTSSPRKARSLHGILEDLQNNIALHELNIAEKREDHFGIADDAVDRRW